MTSERVLPLLYVTERATTVLWTSPYVQVDSIMYYFPLVKARVTLRYLVSNPLVQ